MPLDLTGYKLTFTDEFNSRSISQTGLGTTWASIRSQWRYDAHSDIGFGHSSFVDPSSGYDPFAVAGGALTITAVPDRTPYGYRGSWESGLITTQGTFSQTYGYFEMRARLSDAAGAWDAFWLLPDKAAPNPGNRPGWQELDIVEHYGTKEGGVYSAIHTTDSRPAESLQFYSSHPGLTSGYHTYGMDWQADTIKFYFDGQYMGSRATPSDMHGPMYLLANLATKPIADQAGTPISMSIDYIRVYSKSDGAVAVQQAPVSAPDGRDPGLYGAAAAPHPATDRSAFGAVTHDSDSIGGEIYALYEGLLGRAPDSLGFSGWVDAVERGGSLRAVAGDFLASREGQLRAGALDDTAFVEQLYAATLDRHSDPGGLANWVGALRHGLSRADVGLGFALSREHLDSLEGVFEQGVFVPDKTASDVARLYYGLLDRAPDAGGLRSWTGALDGGLSLDEVAKAFAGSAEFVAQFGGLSDRAFVDRVYESALGRQADSGGMQAWTHALSHGATRGEVGLHIAQSLEAHLHLEPVIEQGWILTP